MPLSQNTFSIISLSIFTFSLAGCGAGESNESSVKSEAVGASQRQFLASKSSSHSKVKRTSVIDTATTVADSIDPTIANTASTTANSATWGDELMKDMTLPHEGLANGVDPTWGWGTAPRLNVGVNFPSYYEAPVVVPWGIAATDATGNPASNVRVQIRKMILDVKRNNVWSRITYKSDYSGIAGSLYTNFLTNTTAPANIRSEGIDGISVKLPEGGGNFHFFTNERLDVPFGAQEIVTTLEARLIVNDPALPDDRAKAKILVNAGADVWRNRTAQWASDFSSNQDIAIGRFKYVDGNWKSFSSHTLQSPDEVNDYLIAEPALLPR